MGAGRTGAFDRDLCTYNLKDATRAKLRTLFAGQYAGSRKPLTVAFVGDSTVAGYGATPGVTGWPEQFREIAIGSGHVDYGEMAAMANRSTGGMTSVSADTRLSVGAGWEMLARTSPVGQNSTTSNPLTFTTDKATTCVRIFLTPTSGPVIVTVDGSFPAAASGPSPATTAATYDSATGTLTPTGVPSIAALWVKN